MPLTSVTERCAPCPLYERRVIRYSGEVPLTVTTEEYAAGVTGEGVAWDMGLVSVAPGARRLAVLAATDTDRSWCGA
ncbi:DUF6183 family protein [Streptomyces hirsutus]|uniref:DUF6183 family protein n=1 Tax=Streptomyces hirsutus TaxID=35620 RepID=UPI0036C3F39E